MQAQPKTLEKKKTFALGYSYVGVSLISYFMTLFCTTGILNTFRASFAEKSGIAATTLLSVVTISGIISQLINVFLGKALVSKAGVRVVASVSLIVGGLFGFILLSQVKSLAGWIISVTILQCCSVGYGTNPANTLISSWFRKRVNTVLGISDIGTSFVSLLGIPVVSKLLANYGFETASIICGIFMICLGIVYIFWIRNKPEDVGMYPDNRPFTEEELQAYNAKKQQAKKWTLVQLLRNPQAWLIAIAFACFIFTLTGAGSNRVAWIMEFGYERAAAVKINSNLAWLGVISSVISGFVVDKIGARKTVITYAIVAIISYASILVFPGQKAMMFFVVAVMYITGGVWTNLLASTTMKVFGAEAYPSVSRMILPVAMMLRSFCYLYTGQAQAILGSISAAYAGFGVIALIGLILFFFIKTDKVQEPKTN